MQVVVVAGCFGAFGGYFWPICCLPNRRFTFACWKQRALADPGSGTQKQALGTFLRKGLEWELP